VSAVEIGALELEMPPKGLHGTTVHAASFEQSPAFGTRTLLLLQKSSMNLSYKSQSHLAKDIGLATEHPRCDVRKLLHAESFQEFFEQDAHKRDIPNLPILLAITRSRPIKHGNNLSCHNALLCRMVVPMFISSKF
jgi:hypothetical protein